MSKNLTTIQVLAKIGKIISEVMFIVSLVGVIVCLVYFSSVFAVEELGIEGTKIMGMVIKGSEHSMELTGYACIYGLIVCAMQAILCRYSYRYFKNELAAGTPFTYEGAKELMRLGILTIVLPYVVLIVHEVAAAILPEAQEIVADDMTEIGFGIMFIVCSVIFKYGAELEAERKSQAG